MLCARVHVQCLPLTQFLIASLESKIENINVCARERDKVR